MSVFIWFPLISTELSLVTYLQFWSALSQVTADYPHTTALVWSGLVGKLELKQWAESWESINKSLVQSCNSELYQIPLQFIEWQTSR